MDLFSAHKWPKKKRSPSYLLALTKDCEPSSGNYSAVHKKSPKQSFRLTHMHMSTRLDRKAPAMSKVTIIIIARHQKEKKKTKGEDPNAGDTQEAGLGKKKMSFI